MNLAKAGKGKLAIWGLSAVIIAAGAYFMFAPSGGDGNGRMRGMNRQVPVTVHTVEARPFADIIEAIGTTRAKESVVLTARVSETVQRVNFNDGDRVEKGTILVELTSSEETAQVREAQANVKEAKQQYDRAADLVKTGNTSRAVLDTRARALTEARARLTAAEARVGDRIIRAPFSGVLGFRMVTVGALVSPGTAVTTLDDVSLMKLDFSVPEMFLSALEEGQVIEAIAAAYPNRVFKGKVRTIGSRVDPITRAVTVRAFIDNADGALRPGMLMSLALTSNPRDALAVEEQSIVPVGRKKFVYRVKADDTVEMLTIETGTRQGKYVEVLSGVNEGDVIVASGTLRLRPGVKIIDTEAPKTEQPQSKGR